MKPAIVRLCCISLCCLLLAGNAGAEDDDFALPELESGRIVLTWSELKSLLDELEALKRDIKALQADEPDQEKPPIEYAIVESSLNGVIQSEFVRVNLSATVQVFTDGWTVIPFLPGTIGVEGAQIAPIEESTDTSALTSWLSSEKNAPRPAAQIVRGADGYDIIARGPAMFAVDAPFTAPVEMENQMHAVTLTPPAAAINTVTVTFQEKGVTIAELTPPGDITQTDESTSIHSSLGQHDQFRVTWKVDKDTGRHRKRSAVVQSLVSVEKSALTVTSAIVLNGLTAFDQAALLLPADVEITRVSSAMIDGWAAEQTEAGQRVTLSGELDRRAPVELSVAYRAPLPELPAQVSIPAIGVEGVELIDGFAGVEVLGSLDVTPADGDQRFLIPAKNLPDALWRSTSSPLLHGYEYHRPNFHAMLDIKRYQEIQTVVANVDLVECVTHRTLAGKSMSRARYFIRNNDRQFLTLTLPENSRIWQAFLDDEPVKPARKDSGDVLIPMKKSGAQNEELQSFVIEIGYVTEVGKLSLKGELISELPGIDIPMSHLRWTLYLPEDYEYTNFEGPLKQVAEFSPGSVSVSGLQAHIDIPMQGKAFLFEKFLMIEETPYVRGKYGQYLGDDIYLTVQPQNLETLQQVTPMLRK